MKIGVISDLHIGDSRCRLLNSQGNLSSDYFNLRDAIMDFTNSKGLDFLVLNGDVMDFSINAIEDSMVKARPFFNSITNDKLTREIVYIPGNHDKQIWDILEIETNIVGNMRNWNDPSAFTRTQPGVIHVKTGLIDLPGVPRNSDGSYGNLFIKGLFNKGNETIINVVYPNLYIKTLNETSIMITHGHMLELAWVLMSELFSGIDIVPTKIGIKELESFNFLLTSMICTGVGQAGDVSKLLYKLQVGITKGDKSLLKKVLDQVGDRIDDLIELKWYEEWMDDALIKGLKLVTMFLASEAESSRYDKSFFEKDSIKKRFIRFFNATLSQIQDLDKAYNGSNDSKENQVGVPDVFIFGHTHEPIPAVSPMVIQGIPGLNGADLMAYNTGGWLNHSDAEAEIIFIDTEIAAGNKTGNTPFISSVNIKHSRTDTAPVTETMKLDGDSTLKTISLKEFA